MSPKFVAPTLILLLVPVVLVLSINCGDWRFWYWNLDKLQAMATGVTGYGLIVFASLTLIFQIQLRTGRRAAIANSLLVDGLAINALNEAWVYIGNNWDNIKLSELQGIEAESLLEKIEIRAILDEAKWNAPDERFYRIIDTRRTWIVRDEILRCQGKPILSYSGGLTDFGENYRPALVSSRGMHELRAWIERVANAHGNNLLSDEGLEMLRPMLIAVAPEDRIKYLLPQVNEQSKKFLRDKIDRYNDLRDKMPKVEK
ncbi:MAG: hypothetical protein H8E48_10220 [Chloroflexi bacterium]|nr:hypothetical protein [Chloroflexota bacterium]